MSCFDVEVSRRQRDLLCADDQAGLVSCNTRLVVVIHSQDAYIHMYNYLYGHVYMNYITVEWT